RPVDIHRLDLVATPDPDHTEFTAECGKGTYVRALARDLGRALGCFGHVTALRRTGVGPFREADTVSLERLQEAASPAGGEARGGRSGAAPNPCRPPLPAAWAGWPALAASRAAPGRPARGKAVRRRGRDAQTRQGLRAVSPGGDLTAPAEAEKGELPPRRIFNL